MAADTESVEGFAPSLAQTVNTTTFWLTPLEEDAWLKSSSGVPLVAVSALVMYLWLYGIALAAKKFTSRLASRQQAIWSRNFVTLLHAVLAVLIGATMLSRKVIDRCEDRLFCFWDMMEYALQSELGYIVFEFALSLKHNNWLQPFTWAENLMLGVLLIIFKLYPTVARFRLLPWWLVTHVSTLFHTIDYFLTASNARWRSRFTNLVMLVAASIFKFLLAALLANKTTSWVMERAECNLPLPPEMMQLCSVVAYAMPAALWFMVFVAFKQVQRGITMSNEKLDEYQSTLNALAADKKPSRVGGDSRGDNGPRKSTAHSARRSKKSKQR